MIRIRSSSIAFRYALYNDERLYKVKIKITLADGTVLNLKEDNIWNGGISYSGGTSESGVFSVGAAVIGQITVVINNIYEEYSNYDFAGATVVVNMGLKLSDERTEFLPFGVYTVDSPDYDESLITLTCLDNLSKADRPYVRHVSFPYSRLELVQDACLQCGLYFNTVNFRGCRELVSPFEAKNITCREILSYVAQMSCQYVRCDSVGSVVFGWYDMAAFGDISYDGGNFIDDTSLETLDGGNFRDYASGELMNGGDFKQNYAKISGHSSSLNLTTDDVVITGVTITASEEEQLEGTERQEAQTYTAGTTGYVIKIENNPLITNSNLEYVTNFIYNQLAGMRFRPFSSSSLSDPCVEPGDAVYLMDRKENAYQSFVTNLKFTIGNYENFTCDAESPGMNTSTQYSAATKNLVEARKIVEQKITAYDLAVQRLTDLMANSFGVYKTEEKQEDGSFIYYMHDKPTVGESKIIWKMTASAMAVSTDGGKTWNAGMDASGNMVVSVLHAIGINADWINAGSMILGGNQTNIDGSIRIYDKTGKLLCSMNKDGVIFDTPNIKLDSGSNMTLWGDIQARSLNVLNAIRITAGFLAGSTGNGLLAVRGGIGNSPVIGGIGNSPCLYLGEEYGHCRAPVFLSPYITTGEYNTDIYGYDNRVVLDGANAYIGGELLARNLKESYCHLDQPINGNNCSVDITFRASGAFVAAYGTYRTYAHKAGAAEEIRISEGIFPKHVGARGISYGDKKVFVFFLGTDGVFSVRNTSETNVSSQTPVEVNFRMDYTTI